MKKVIVVLVCLAAVLTVRADEGMWLPNLIGSRIPDMKAKGFRLSAEDIYSINKASLKDAVVLFGRGCTGEIVSSEGLLFTNHHCGYPLIQQHSDVDHDYLRHGFWAMNRSEELPNPGLTVSILQRMDDVTEAVLEGVEDGMTAVQREATIAANSRRIIDRAQQEGRWRASVEPFYYGNQYFLFVYEEFRDVRLVGAPPSSIGKFGGDTDNWMWPRHTGDFAVFRIYAGKDNKPADYAQDNVPYRPARHFEISTQGVREGDFTFIYGFPGSTQRYILSDAAEYILERSNPAKIKLRTIRLDIMGRAMEADPQTRIRYASKHASVANSWKKWQGESLGLKRLGTVEKKREQERRFGRWAEGQAAYGGLLDSMRRAYAEEADGYFLREYYGESVAAIELRQPASVVRKLAGGGKLNDKGRESVAAFYRDYEPKIDRAIAVRMLEEFVRDIPAAQIPAAFNEAVAAHGGIAPYVDHIFATSRLTTAEGFAAAAADSASLAQTVRDDPMVGLLEAFDRPQYAAAGVRNLSDLPAIARWYRPYMRALMEYEPERAFFPDANLTLRVAYGSVEGYVPRDGERHLPQTTLDGIIAKDDPAIYDYDIPQRLREQYAAKDYGRWGIQAGTRRHPAYTVPVAFLATNHTTGGNSGSPVIDGRGRLIGINFDRTWLSTMSDIEFDPAMCRNIAVDIRYVLFVIDKVGGAGYLIDELDIR